MNRIKTFVRRGEKEDIVRGAAIYLVMIFLVLFLVLPLCTLFLKAFQDKSGAFAGLSQFAKYFQSKSMVYSISHTFFTSVMPPQVPISG